MGFTGIAAELFGKVKGKLAAKDAAAASEIEAAMGELLKAWPEINGPAKPVIDAAGVKALVDKIEQKAAAFKG